ncbi:MAG: flippase-like domain-containing protein [Phycisphaerae bacterium]|nr:flippase-like domain-containing protein [Phycisphaerae bacterium]
MTTKENQKLKPRLLLLLRIVIAAVACYIIFKDVDFRQVGLTLKRMHPLVLPAASLIYIFSQALLGLRWWIFLRAQGVAISLWLTIKLTFLGLFFNNFMPSSVGGDLIRAWYVSQHSPKKLQAALGVIIDRIMGLVSTLIIAVAGYLLFMRGQKGMLQVSHSNSLISSLLERYPHIRFYSVILVVLIVISVFVLGRWINFEVILKRLFERVLYFWGQLKEVITIYYHYPLVLVVSFGLTLLLQSIVILSYWAIGRELGIGACWGYYFVFFPIVWIIGSIPISIAGIGILEGGVVFLFVTFAHADLESVTALALCQRITWIAASLPGMIVHLLGPHHVGNKQ